MTVPSSYGNKSRDDVQQRRFAAAAGSHDRHELAVVDRERHVTQREHFAPSRSSQYRLETWPTSSFTMHRAYRKASLALRSSSALMAAPNSFSKNPLFHQPLHRSCCR